MEPKQTYRSEYSSEIESQPAITQGHRSFLAERGLLILFGLALALNLAIYAYLTFTAPRLVDLPFAVAYDPFGLPARIGYLPELFWIPQLGTLILLANLLLALLLYKFERLAAYLLFTVALAGEAILLSATINTVILARS